MIQWNEEFQCLCDIMGLPLTAKEVRLLRTRLRSHAKLSPSRLMKIHNALMEANNPTLTQGFCSTPQRFINETTQGN